MRTEELNFLCRRHGAKEQQYPYDAEMPGEITFQRLVFL
jgi:hypothetical protein